VEFALVALPVIFILLEASPLTAWVRKKIKKTKTAGVLITRFVPIAAALVLIVTAWDRVSVGTAVADRYPDKALDFVSSENIAFRPFNTIGFGSYLVWDLYGKRQSFIDGRNFSPALYQDFLMSQSSASGPAAVARKYRLDSFIIPPLESSDAGMTNIHKALARDKGWTLVYLDARAWVYAKNETVESGWLSKHGYVLYHPLNLSSLRLDESTTRQLVSELERAVSGAPNYLQPRLDLALVHAVVGNNTRALEELDAAKELAPENPVVWNRIGNAALDLADHQRAIAAFLRLKQLAPEIGTTWLNLGRAYAQAGEQTEAISALEKTISINPGLAEGYEVLFRLYAQSRRWAEAENAARRMANALPADYRSYYYLAASGFEQGKNAEASRYAQKALQINPRAAEVYLMLADVYARAQNFAAALENVERALTLAPNNKAALDLRERLRSVQP
jgi:tetratricopeptide (TPR) repeat protein